MKNIILLFMIFTTTFFGCKPKKEAISTQSVGSGTKEEVASNTISNSFENLTQNDSLFVSIDKGMCFGNCANYQMKIYNNGTAVLNAVRGVELKGKYTSEISQIEMKLFIEKAKEINYFEMKNIYDSKSVTDLPTVVTSIVINGERKTVKRRYDYPTEIQQFEGLFDNLLASLKWIRVADSSNN